MAGAIESYIHTGNQIGVLVELRCQSKTTAMTSEFKTLAREIAMQIAACPNVEYLRLDDIPPETVDKKKKIEINRDDLEGKPDNIKKKIVADRIDKRLNEIALLPQLYIRDNSLTIEDLIKLRAAQLAENIFVNRFARFAIDDSQDYNPPQPDGGVPVSPFPITPTPLASEAEANEDEREDL